MSSTASPKSRARGLGAAISVRRFANDEIARVGSSLQDLGEAHRFEFLCECGDLSCNRFVRMTIAEYRASPPGSVVSHHLPGGLHDSVLSQRPVPDAATLAAANEHILLHVRDSDDGEQEWEFVCECGKEDCHEQVSLTLTEFEELRSGGNIVLAPGHVPSQIARAEVLIANAEALRRQAQHQVKRAKKNLGSIGGLHDRQ